jgi:hypothetical protein
MQPTRRSWVAAELMVQFIEPVDQQFSSSAARFVECNIRKACPPERP